MPSRGALGVRKQGKARSKSAAPGALKLFISHSSKDLVLVELLVGLLEEALDLRSEQIRCTSLPGYGLQAGASVEERLRTEVEQAEVLVGVITEASLDSLYVAFELGARWHLGKPLIPLLGPGLDTGCIPEPLHGKHALQCSDEGLFQLIENLEYLRPSGKNERKTSALYPAIKAIREYAQERMSPEWYGIQFTAPDEGTVVKRRLLPIKGKFKNRPPHGTLHVFHASDDWNRWWPLAEPELKDRDGSWSAEVEFEKGHNPYYAWLVVALVRNSGADLVRYFRKLPRHLEIAHREGRGELEKHTEFNSLFGGIRPDSIEVCAKRKVHIDI